MVDTENLDGELPVSPESDEGLRLQRIINDENEKPAKETANVLSSGGESDDSLAAYKAAMAELRQAKERLYQNIDELLLSASMVMLNSELTFDERIKKAISKYEKADTLASDLDDEPSGKKKHLEVLYAYKNFLQNYEPEGKDEKLKRVEASISELTQEQDDEEIYNQVDELLIKISTSMLIADDRGTMTAYKELDNLLSKVDNTLEGKNKHLIALRDYKKFLEKCRLKERNDELTRVETRISELRQDDEEEQDNEEIYKQIDQILIDITSFMMVNNDKRTMAAYKKLDGLLSKVDNTLEGKNKHLIALRDYKKFLEKCRLKERNDELIRVESLISELSQK